MTDVAFQVHCLLGRPYLFRLVSHYRHLRQWLSVRDSYRCAQHLARKHLT